MSNDGKRALLLAYVVAWIAYLGAFLTKLSNVGNVVRDSFSDIKPPQKDEYYK